MPESVIQTVCAVRSREGEDLGVLPLDQAIELLTKEAMAPDQASRLQEQQDLFSRLMNQTAEAG